MQVKRERSEGEEREREKEKGIGCVVFCHCHHHTTCHNPSTRISDQTMATTLVWNFHTRVTQCSNTILLGVTCARGGGCLSR